MTINIAVVTSEALVLGCDSIASATNWYVPAFGGHSSWNEEEQIWEAKYTPELVVSQVTNSIAGVTKLFHLHGGNTPVAAVTAGPAKLKDRTMSSYAHEFYTARALAGFQLQSVGDVANEFLAFMRGKYDEHYQGSEIPEEYREGPQFLVGGYGATDHLPCLYRINVQKNTARIQYPNGRYGIAWEGQSDAVERLMRGYDSRVRAAVEEAVASSVTQLRQSMAEHVAALVQGIVDRVGAEAVGEMQVDLPGLPDIVLPWEGHEARVQYGNLPLQDAIDFAAYLVNLQSGRAKFGDGVATVGGRTHIGVITKQSGFFTLGEPELTHRNTGFV